MMLYRNLKTEESKRFNESPYLYASVLFLLLYSLTFCLWSISNITGAITLPFSYNISFIVTLILTLLILIPLDIEAHKLSKNSVTEN